LIRYEGKGEGMREMTEFTSLLLEKGYPFRRVPSVELVRKDMFIRLL
jgi:dihydroxyacid dehydratase/phosphogluconate dehydratase